MARCTRKTDLEVHHKRRDGGNDLNNAEVLCQKCHSATATYGVSGKRPSEFSEQIKEKAREHAGNRCECRRTGGCH